jgi:large subunit ribosomal protein L32e
MTTEKQRLLKVKATLKRRQPKFIRQDAHKRSMKEGWRSPKGLHSKIGDNRKGYRKGLKGGYQTPVAVRGLDKHGLKPTRVETLTQLSALEPKTHSVIMSGSLGGRKKLLIIDAAKTKGFTILNASDKTVTRIKESHAAKSVRKNAREAKQKEREAAAASKSAKKAEKKEEAKAEKKEEKKPDVHNQPHEHDHNHAHDREKKSE